MDYSKLSDGEISVRLAYFLKPKFEATIHPYDASGAKLSWRFLGTTQSTGFFPLRNSDDLFPSLKKHRISLSTAGKAVWKASHESGAEATHRNPLRAVAIVFLMMQDGQK